MIKLEKTDIYGWEAAIRGMRNPLNSWERIDSRECEIGYYIGPQDHDLMMRLAKGGSTHAKYRRMITVYVDITAPLYWWKEFDTYKVGTVANSCSTMHKIHDKEFTIDDFSHEHLLGLFSTDGELADPSIETAGGDLYSCSGLFKFLLIPLLNECRELYLLSNDKKYWWQMIQLLPSSYNQKRTVMLNYEVLAAMYNDRKNHKLDEWHTFCDWIRELPYSEIITGAEAENG